VAPADLRLSRILLMAQRYFFFGRAISIPGRIGNAPYRTCKNRGRFE
jgi:hypothetical protein